MAKTKKNVDLEEAKTVSKKKSSSMADIVDESSEEVLSTNIPPFVKGKYLVVQKVHPSKGKDTRDGFTLMLILISYLDEKGAEIKLVQVEEGDDGLEVTFPKGTNGIASYMYAGPKSKIRYRRLVDGKEKWFQVDPKKLSYKYFLEKITRENPASKKWNDDQLDDAYVEYLETFWNFALTMNFNNEASEENIPVVGMASWFYRKVSPPKQGERYNQVNISKFPGAALKEKFPAIDGKFSHIDESVATTILEAFQATKVKKDDVDFNYGANAADAPAEEDVI